MLKARLSYKLKNNSRSGFAILEFSILFIVTSILIFGVWGLVAMLQAQRVLEYRADKVFYEQTLPIWKVADDLSLVLNTKVIENYLSAEAEKIFSSVLESNDLTPGKQVYLELATAQLNINSRTGAAVGAPVVKSIQRRGSSSFVSSQIMAETNFEKLFSKFNKVDSKGVSLWAVPFAKGAQLNYRDSTFFVACRIYVEAEGFAAWFKNILGFEPIYFVSRAYALRGDVEL